MTANEGMTQAQLVQAYQSVARSEEGQRVIADLMHHFGYTRRSMFNPGDDTASLAYKEGQRSVLVHVGKMIDVDPSQLEEEETDVTKY